MLLASLKRLSFPKENNYLDTDLFNGLPHILSHVETITDIFLFKLLSKIKTMNKNKKQKLKKFSPNKFYLPILILLLLVAVLIIFGLENPEELIF